MGLRTVRRGFIVYNDVEGRPVTGYLGDEVDVHEDDLARFDRHNGPEVNEIISDDPHGEPIEIEAEPVPDASDSSWTHERIDEFVTTHGLSYDGMEAKNAEKPTREEKVAHIRKTLPEAVLVSAEQA